MLPCSVSHILPGWEWSLIGSHALWVWFFFNDGTRIIFLVESTKNRTEYFATAAEKTPWPATWELLLQVLYRMCIHRHRGVYLVFYRVLQGFIIFCKPPSKYWHRSVPSFSIHFWIIAEKYKCFSEKNKSLRYLHIFFSKITFTYEHQLYNFSSINLIVRSIKLMLSYKWTTPQSHDFSITPSKLSTGGLVCRWLSALGVMTFYIHDDLCSFFGLLVSSSMYPDMYIFDVVVQNENNS